LSDDSLVMQLLTSSKCEVCGQFFEEINIKILGHTDEMWILQVSCGGCHSQTLLAVMVDEENEPESKTVEELTDLMEYEVDNFKEVIITNNDLLDMFIFLNALEGDVSRLFRDPKIN
jgi:hypothetical protein